MGRQRCGQSALRARASCGLLGNSEAVWPSSPMPSTSTSIGSGNSVRARLAPATEASSETGLRYRPIKWARAASPLSRWRLTSASLLSLCSTGTQRSSARLTTMRDHSRWWVASASRNATGLRPPDNTRLAKSRSRKALVSAAATQVARSMACCLAEACSSTCTPVGNCSSEIAIPGPPITGNQRHRRHRSPGTGRVRLGWVTELFPAGNQLVAPQPGVLDLVFAHEQVLVALGDFQQQPLVGIGDARAFVGFGKIQLQRA